MPNVDPTLAERMVAEIFAAHGVPSADGELVAKELVRAEVMGISSHGLVRVTQYVTDIRSGRVKPGTPIRVLSGEVRWQ